MQKVLEVVSRITRYTLAIVACVSFAQFLLLIGVHKERAQVLAGETLGRAILCGAVAGWWFYRESRRKVPKPAGESLPTAQHSATLEKAEPIVPTEVRQVSPLPDVKPETQSVPLSDNHSFLLIAGLSIVVVVVIVWAISNAPSSSSIHDEKPEIPNLPVFDTAAQRPPSPASPCGSGIPAGVKVVPIELVNGLQVNGSEGEASYDSTAHEIEYTLEQYAEHGYKDTSYYVGEWFFSFKLSNDTGINRPDRQFPGYCLTDVEYEVDIQSPDGRHWKTTEKVNVGAEALSPGWWKRLSANTLHLPKRLKDGTLTNWRITKAWGFPLVP